MLQKKSRRVLSIILCIGILLGLTGCQSQFLLRDRLLIQGIGVDYEGETYKICIQAIDIAENGDAGVVLYETEGETVIDALNNVTLQVGKKPVYSHNLTVVMGRNCAEHGLQETIDFFIRHAETRAAVKILMAEGKAKEIVSYERDGEILPITDLEDLIKQSRLNGKNVNVSLVELVNLLDDPSSSPYLPTVGIVGKDLQTVGTAIFDHQGVFKDLLTPDETRGLVFLTDRMERGIQVFTLEDKTTVSLEITQSKTSVSTQIIEGIPRFLIDIRCTANVDAIDGGPHEIYGKEYYDILAQELEKNITQQVESIINRCIFQQQADVFSFGRRLHQSHASWWKENEQDWPDIMRKSDYTVNVETRIARVGQELSPTLDDQ